MRNAKLIIPALAVVAIAIVIAVVTGFSHGQSTSRSLVGKANVGGRTILVNRRGLTLYHLSVERKGHFICKDMTCLSIWKPLVVGRSGELTGAKFLGRVKRPDGRFQLTYRGGPLYTFVQDRKRGDMKGDGFKDVGVWHPVFLTGKAATSPPPPPPPGYGSSY